MDRSSSIVAIVLSLFFLAYCVLLIVAYWKAFTKAGKAGWKSLIPFYSSYCMFDIAVGNGILFLLILIPCVGWFVPLWMYFKFAKAYGYGTGIAVLNALIPGIGMLIIGFSDAEYIGPETK